MLVGGERFVILSHKVSHSGEKVDKCKINLYQIPYLSSLCYVFKSKRILWVMGQ